MRRFGLIGYPLGHSFSQAFFTDRFRNEGGLDCVYGNFPIESIGQLPALILQYPDLEGLNVTIPYKQAVLPYLDELDPQARQIGAVNCIRIFRDPDGIRLKGYNTDAWGFRQSLLGMLGDARPKALVLGTGGASKAVAYVLAESGIPFRFVSRQGSANAFSYEELTPGIIAESPLIINTTPLGMHPQVSALPAIPYGAVTPNHFLYDLVYNPAETAFLREGRVRGAIVMNGYAMLVGQAERSWEIWNEAR